MLRFGFEAFLTVSIKKYVRYILHLILFCDNSGFYLVSTFISIFGASMKFAFLCGSEGHCSASQRCNNSISISISLSMSVFAGSCSIFDCLFCILSMSVDS